MSNTFDYTVTLEGGGGPGDPATVLRGVEERAEVGLLSLFEHYQSTTVGEHLKTPAFPVWLVCSESHFSVLWRVQNLLFILTLHCITSVIQIVCTIAKTKNEWLCEIFFCSFLTVLSALPETYSIMFSKPFVRHCQAKKSWPQV